MANISAGRTAAMPLYTCSRPVACVVRWDCNNSSHTARTRLCASTDEVEEEEAEEEEEEVTDRVASRIFDSSSIIAGTDSALGPGSAPAPVPTPVPGLSSMDVWGDMKDFTARVAANE